MYNLRTPYNRNFSDSEPQRMAQVNKYIYLISFYCYKLHITYPDKQINTR